jgi:Tol biopolymer transport system component
VAIGVALLVWAGLWFGAPAWRAIAQTPGLTGDIAFMSYRSGPAPTIWVMGRDGSNPHQIASCDSCNGYNGDGEPSWSPDGKHIVFIQDCGNQDDSPGNLEVMNSDGTGVKRVGSVVGARPAWSPDGSKIAYEDTFTPDIYVTNADGTGSPVDITNTPSDWPHDPAWSPDGSEIAYAGRDAQYNYGIFVIPAAGGTPVMVANMGSGLGEYPSWSPDGSWIVFDDLNRALWVVRADGSHPPKQITTYNGNYQPSWSASGAKILFASTRDGNPHVYEMNRDGTNQVPIDPVQPGDTSPSWQSTPFLSASASPDPIVVGHQAEISGRLKYKKGPGSGDTIHIDRTNPDGSKTTLPDVVTDVNGNYSEADTPPSSGAFLYEASFDGSRRDPAAHGWASLTVLGAGMIVFDSNRTGNYEIFTIDPDGSHVVQLTFNSADDYAPAWSADAKKITFGSNRSGNYDVWVMNADGSHPVDLTNNSSFDGSSQWSPDGSKIAFESDRAGNPDIWTMNADGSNLKQITKDTHADALPSWSPDGSKLVFDSNRAGNYDIYSINADGTGLVQLTKNPANDGAPTWSPDGSTIAFTSDRSGNADIWTMNPDGSNVKQITSSSADDFDESYSPDGTKFAFESLRSGSDQIWVMNADGSAAVQFTKTGKVNEYPNWGTALPVGDAPVRQPFGVGSTDRSPQNSSVPHRIAQWTNRVRT